MTRSNGKIVHIITRFIRAGADENTLLTCKSQTEDGYDVYLVHGANHDAGYLAENRRYLTPVHVPAMVRQLSPLRDLKSILALYSFLRRTRPDVVHTHTSKAGILGRWAAFFAGVPVIVHGVHIAPFKNVGRFEQFAYWALEKITSRITHAYFDVSEGMKAAYLASGIGSPAKHTVVHSGFDLSKFRNTTASPDTFTTRSHTIVMVAAFTKRKRQIELIRALGRVWNELPETQMHFCGEGEMLAEAKSLVAALGLEDRVKFLGFRTDVENVMATADLCVLSSEREGLPRVVMQYLAAGKPCVVTRLPGIEEVVREGKNGVIVDADRLDLFCDAMARILRDDRLYEELRAGALSTDLSSWDARLMWPRMKIVYDSLVSSRHPAFASNGSPA